jgi:4-diphosphocytidyl-2-C-methyl-D-erythritol kinase
MYSKKAYAKVNIFLKIAAKRDNYHELVSRFCRVHTLYDTIYFKKTIPNKFTLKGDFGCALESNTIYKVYKLLKQEFNQVEEFFKIYSVEVEKNIPEFAGLGGGSSDAATFLLMCNEYIKLNLSKEQLCRIAKKIGADVPFFVYEYDSANVTGIGEIVEKFNEEILDIEVYTPKDIKCDTKEVFQTFRSKYYKQITTQEKNKLLNMKSIDIFNQYDISKANDLYLSALDLYQELQKVTQKKKYFFSGSGSSFFTIKQKENQWQK